MRRTILLALSLLVAGCTAVQPKPTPPPANEPGANPVDPPPSSVSLKVIRFVDPQHGWAGGDGVILATGDGGHTWVKQYEGPAVVAGLDFTDSAHGWAVSSQGLLRTSDGGRTWTPSDQRAQSVDFVTADVGWAQMGTDLYRSADGGRTWQRQETPAGIASFCASDPATVWATAGPTVVGSRDGGKSWAKVFDAPVEGRDRWKGALHCGGGAAWVLFTGGVGMSHQAYVVFRTTDGGHRWEPMLASGWASMAYPTVKVGQAIDAYSGPFDVVDSSTAFFLGSCSPCGDGTGTSSITRTADGGRTWHQDQIPSVRSVETLSFVDAKHGWTLVQTDDGSAILSTADGGRTWVRHTRPDR